MEREGFVILICYVFLLLLHCPGIIFRQSKMKKMKKKRTAENATLHSLFEEQDYLVLSSCAIVYTIAMPNPCPL